MSKQTFDIHKLRMEDACADERTEKERRIDHLEHDVEMLTNAGVVECMVRNKAVFERIDQLERDLAAVTAERDALRSSDDGNGTAWCATCGGLMQAVRPGKHQCVACEHYDHLRTKLHDAEAERDAMLNLLDSPDLIEELSALEHERWAGWMQYQDTAPEAKRADWPRKASLPYSALTDQEKESDRIEVRKTLSLIRAAIDAARGAK